MDCIAIRNADIRSFFIYFTKIANSFLLFGFLRAENFNIIKCALIATLLYVGLICKESLVSYFFIFNRFSPFS